jgi:rhodanese-related sulfurtransferase
MTLRDGIPLATLLADADAEVEVVTAAHLDKEIGAEDLVVIDLRDIRELTREGHLPGSDSYASRDA